MFSIWTKCSLKRGSVKRIVYRTLLWVVLWSVNKLPIWLYQKEDCLTRQKNSKKIPKMTSTRESVFPGSNLPVCGGGTCFGPVSVLHWQLWAGLKWDDSQQSWILKRLWFYQIITLQWSDCLKPTCDRQQCKDGSFSHLKYSTVKTPCLLCQCYSTIYITSCKQTMIIVSIMK